MKTVRGMKIVSDDETQLHSLDELMRVFGSAKRYAFNRLLEGRNAKEIIKHLPHQFRLNKRYAEDAVLLAQSLISSQRELLPMRLEDVQAKIEKTAKKIDEYQYGRKTPKNVDLPTCLGGLRQRLEKLKAKEAELKRHLDQRMIPRVIFGGKQNFCKRLKGKITNEEWKDLRSNQLYARGDKSKKGNLNIRLLYDDNTYECYVEIANPLGQQESKTAPRLRFPVSVPEKYEEEIINLVMGEQVGVNAKGKPIINYQPYTVEIKRKNGEYYIHLIYEEEVYGRELTYDEPIQAERIAGMDINIDRIAVSIVSKQGNFLQSKVFYCHELEYVRANKRNNIVGETVRDVYDWLLQENVGAVVIENIQLRQQHDTDKRFNRFTHNFKKKKLTDTIIRRGMRLGFRIKKVNPAYTSVIGRFKYRKKYGLSVHESAALVIGRRGLGYRERLPKELIHIIKTKVKRHLVAVLGSMEESYKQSKSGTKQRQYLGRMLKKIENFKEEHEWSLWNVLHKCCWLNQDQIQLKEV
ncbi:IS200/IS605 family accessory protein TnpB-related protein [Saccharococcus caldoxylosilyticus]|uniref:Putative transposase n=2 Tax=Saccharococcus caldoxylosilyticus TaxID=81408 RepID=A0A023DHM4_9BACL|nr:IS200/IS605 family accessory protein TnpB-related protein [Parageobacillus caldoxylosilyticus]MBB3853878.1 IS605 OrfB family transposase [Parageobacillus caldoxylosilyticus]GAJ40743.1 putative transposase [Parageobacillus caldoxylosilyticus NBRC 107762]